MSSKLIKTISFTIIGLLIVFLGLFFAITKFIDPNSFKPQIRQFVKEKTGRTISIGNISWSFFPTAGLKVREIVLGNPENKGFNTPFFAKIEKAAINIRVLSLLHKKIDIEAIQFQGAHIILIKNKQSETNWEDVFPKSRDLKTEKSGASPAEQSHTSGFQLSTSAISFKKAQIEWWDQKAGQRIYLKELSLYSSAIKPNQPFSLNIATELSVIHSNAEAGATPAKKLPITVDADVSFDRAAQAVKIDNLSVNIAGIKGQGNAKGTDLSSDKLKFVGTFKLLPFDPKKTLALIGYDLKLKNAQRLAKAEGDIHFVATDHSFSFDTLKLTVDDTHVDGNMTFGYTPVNTLDFNIHIDKLATDDYSVIPASDNPMPSKSKPEPSKSPQEFTIQNSTLSIDKLTLGKLNMTQLTTKVESKDGIIQFAPISVQLYGGKASGGLTVNLKRSIPQYMLNINLDNVDTEQLLLAQTKQASITGKLRLNANLTTQGSSKDTLIRKLNGKGRFNLVSGKIKVLDAGQILSLATAIVNKQPRPKTSSLQETTFDKITGSFFIKNGVIQNTRLGLYSTTISATGSGLINLNINTIDYLLKIKGVKSITTNNNKESIKLYDWFVPVRIVGPLEKLSVRPDYQSISKQVIKHQVKKKLLKKLDEKTRKSVGGIIDTLLP